MKSNLIDWAFGPLVAVIGWLNLLLVHPVPGIACLLLSLIYVRPVTGMLERRWGIVLRPAFRVAVGVAVIWFTLGVSDLGDMID